MSTLSRMKAWFIPVILSVTISACKKSAMLLEKAAPEIVLQGNRLSSNIIHLFSDTVYILAANLSIQANQQLLIDPGTLIKVKNNIEIVVNSGGKITANGTAVAPIVFTSNALQGTAGSTPSIDKNAWAGITINGPVVGSSASLKYIRIEFAGTGSSAALSLRNIDSTAVIQYIQVSYSFNTPSFEFIGGNCQASNLVSYASSGTDFILSGGYTGKLQHILGYRHPYLATNINPLTGLYIQGAGTLPAISNMSVIGPDLQPGMAAKYNDTAGAFSGGRVAALVVAGTAKFHIRNSVFSGFPKAGFYMDNRESATSLQAGQSGFTYNFIHSNDTNRVFYIPANLVPSNPPITSKEFKSFMLQAPFHNQLFLTSSDLKYSSPYNYDVSPNAAPQAGSPMLSGANFDGPVFSNTSFFKPVTHRGAIGTDNWLQGWTNFLPLQTNYNN
jgi:hypothetical protein